MSLLCLAEEDLGILSMCLQHCLQTLVLLGVQCTKMQEKGTDVVKFPVTVTVV